MKRIKFKQLARSIWPLFLLALSVTSAHAQPQKTRADIFRRPDRNSADMASNRPPANSVRVVIRYNKEYGYQPSKSGPPSCGAFAVDFSWKDMVGPIRAAEGEESRLVESEGYYVCNFLASDLPLNQEIKIKASLGNERDATETWSGASPLSPGQRRAILGGTRSVTLTEGAPRASLNFEMIYTPAKTSTPEPPIREQPVPRRKIPLRWATP